MGVIVLRHPRKTLAQALDHIRPEVPPMMQALLDPTLLEAQLAKAWGLGQAQLQSTLKSPWAFAALAASGAPSPSQLKSSIVAAIPWKDGPALLALLSKNLPEKRDLGDSRWALGQGGQSTLFIEFANGYAYAASTPANADVARSILEPALKSSKKADLAATIHADRIYATYRGVIEMGLALLTSKKKEIRAVARDYAWLRHIRSTKQATLNLTWAPKHIAIGGTLLAQRGGELSTFYSSLLQRPAWGANLLAGNCGLFVSSHQKPEQSIADVKASVDTLLGLSTKSKAGAFLGKILRALWKSLEAQLRLANGSESYAACSFANDSYIGAMGRLKAGSGAKAKKLSDQFGRLVTRHFAPALKAALSMVDDKKLRRELKRLRLRLRNRRGALKASGATGDLVELRLRWPKGAFRDKDLERAKRMLKPLFGNKLTMGLAVIESTEGPVSLVFLSKKPKATFAKLVEAIKSGGQSPTSVATKASAGKRPLISFIHLSLGHLLEQMLPLLAALPEMPAKVLTLLTAIRPHAQKTQSANIDAIVDRQGDEARIEMRISTSVVGLLARGITMAMLKKPTRNP